MAIKIGHSSRRVRVDTGGNRLLALLSDDDRAALEPHLKPFELKPGVTLLRPLVPVKHVYFISEGLVSLVQLLDNGKYTETGIVGREGMVGALVPLGAVAFSNEAQVQIPGMSLRMDADKLRVQVALRPGLRDLLMRYIQALFSQVAQSVSCNGQHPLDRRLARWLSMGADCIESDTLPLTHELLATMLGVRRSGVTEGLAALKAKGRISTIKGGVRVLNRLGLESDACECHEVVRMEYRRLLGPSVFPPSSSSPSRRRA